MELKHPAKEKFFHIKKGRPIYQETIHLPFLIIVEKSLIRNIFLLYF